jgi:4-diphosphocytidyl-2-C-methyl-D-erythritol kinase
MTDRSYIAPAKINLGLEIVRKRADGYHDINTVFYRLLEPRDSVRVREAPIFRLTCSDASLPSDARNLMVKAAHAYTERAGCPLPKIEVHLEKQIPTGAGLGGGSSDAATMLEIMQDYAGGLDNDTLYKLGAQIGADVPFFMIGGLAAAAQGIGDELTPIDLELEHSILIVKDPQIFVSTKEAYDGLEIGQAEIHDFTALFETEVSLEEMKAELRNDFEPTVFRRYPRLQQIKQALYDRGAGFALMSGSGSSIYGLFEDASEAIEASLQFESEGLQTFLSNPRG